MNIPIDSEPVILDQEDPDAPPMQLIYPEESEDEFGRPRTQQSVTSTSVLCNGLIEQKTNKQQPSNSWHVIRNQLHNQARHEQRFPSTKHHKNHHESCACRIQDFHPMDDAPTPCSTSLTTKTEINPRQFIHLKSKTNLRYVMESLLTAAMTHEMEATDAYQSMYEHYNSLNECLAYVSQYLDCICLETRSLSRLCAHVSRANLVSLESEHADENCTLGTLLNQLSSRNSSEYYWMKKEIAAELDATADVNELIRNYTEKKNDFHKAIQNMRVILDTNFTTGQLQKLKKQFDLIQEKFVNSRKRLERKLPKIICRKNQVLVNTFGMLAEDMQSTANDKNDFAVVCQHLETALREKINDINMDSQCNNSDTVQNDETNLIF